MLAVSALVVELAGKYGQSPAQVALNWCLATEGWTNVPPRPRPPAQTPRSRGTRETRHGGNVLVEYGGSTHLGVESPVRRNPGGACDHTALLRVSSPGPIPRATRHQLAALAAVPLAKGLAGWSFRVEGMVFAERAACGCPEDHALMRFLSKEGTGPCRRCGQRIRPLPHFTHDPVPATMLVDVVDRPLWEIGAALARSVVIRGPAGGVLVNAGAAGGGSHDTP